MRWEIPQLTGLRGTARGGEDDCNNGNDATYCHLHGYDATGTCGSGSSDGPRCYLDGNTAEVECYQYGIQAESCDNNGTNAGVCLTNGNGGS